MEQCLQHKELTDKTDKILTGVDQIKVALMGDIGDPTKVGLMSRIATLENKVVSLESAKNNILAIGYRVIGALAVGGISIKTVMDAIK